MASRASARCSLSYSPDTDGITGHLHLIGDPLDRLANRSPQIAAAHVESHRYVATVALAVDVVRAILDLHASQLRQRYPLARWGEQANVGDGLRVLR